MAGDWIKVEVATMQKAEVGMFAELLGIPVDHAFGLLIRFWMWLDANSRDGRVTHVSHLSVDTNMHTIGFAAALERVGWLFIDDETHVMTVPNFDRHNGNSAKSRALHARRQAKLRDGRVTLDASPREEKRRVSTSLRSVDKQRATRLPDDWKPSDLDIAFAKRERPGWDDAQVARTADAFRDYWRAAPKGSKLDWSATWRTWVRKERGATKTVHDKRSAVAEAMYGNALREMGYGSSGEAIAGESTRVD